MMKRKPISVAWLGLLCVGCLFAATWFALEGSASAQPAPDGAAATTTLVEPAATTHAAEITLWEPLTSAKYAPYEKILLCLNVVVALAGLGYAFMLVGQ